MSTSVSEANDDYDNDNEDVEELTSSVVGGAVENENEDGSSEDAETEESAYGSKDSGYQSLPGRIESREKW